MTKFVSKSAKNILEEADTGIRNAGPIIKKTIFFTCILFSLFQLYIASKLPGLLAQATDISIFVNIVAQARYVHLAFAILLATLAFPIFGHKNRVPWYDWLMVLLGVSACLYLVIFRFEIADRPGLWSSSDIIMSAIGMFVLMVAVYRSLGIPLVIIAGLFLALAFFGGYSSWIGSITNYGGASFTKAMGHYWMQTEGVFGVALGVSTTMIFLFVLFGSLLEKAGGGNWFIKVAISLLGALRGGPAKAAVLSSMMTGMISGSSIANTVTTGTFTIPLMKRIGFSGEKAGAVEVASSTNGQLTPPVMGAAAFLMVEYVNISYLEVIKHAFLPAVISYIALLYIVHLESLKMGLKGLNKPGRRIGVYMILLLFISGFLIISGITFLLIIFRAALEPFMPGNSVYPALALLFIAYMGLLYIASKYPDIEVDDPNAKTVKAPRLTPTFFGGAYFALPIFVLVWNLMVRTEYLDRLSPALSAFWATIAMIIIALSHRPIKALYRGELKLLTHWTIGFKEFVDGLEAGARNMIGIGVATGAAGIIVGTISLTGAHQIIGQVIETLSGGNLIVLLILVAILSLILGMGLPTTANYIVVSSLMAPVIVSVGAQSGLIVPLIAVHMFVFYFGILADDTPPVGLAAYAAAAISRGDPIKTGLIGFSYDIRTALLPFMFIFNTDLLLINVGPVKAVFVFIVSLIAMLLFAAVTQGYFIAKSRKWESAILLLIVFMLFRPDFFLDRWQDKYTEYSGHEALVALEELPIGTNARLRISAPDFDSGIIGKKTINFIPEIDGSASDRLNISGLSIVEEDGVIILDEPFPGTQYFGILANDFDFYGNQPAQIEAVGIENHRILKEIFFIPAFILLLLIIYIQKPRAKQSPF